MRHSPLGSFSLGTSAGVLLSGVLIGQLRIPIPALLEAVSFALFIFEGPQGAARTPIAIRSRCQPVPPANAFLTAEHGDF
jgi:hypothetical protein